MVAMFRRAPGRSRGGMLGSSSSTRSNAFSRDCHRALSQILVLCCYPTLDCGGLLVADPGVALYLTPVLPLLERRPGDVYAALGQSLGGKCR